jgi:hypothetical protein
MSFFTDTDWPPYMADFLDASESDGNYNGFYNSILFHVFDDFKGNAWVTPEKHRFNSLYLTINDNAWNPILITHVGSDVSPRGRVNADTYIRLKFAEHLSRCPHRRLWGLSFVGSSLRVYCGDAETHTVVPPAEDLVDGAWNIETLSPVGFALIKEIGRELVREM